MRGGVIRHGGVSRNRGMSGGGRVYRSGWVIGEVGGSSWVSRQVSRHNEQMWRAMGSEQMQRGRQEQRGGIFFVNFFVMFSQFSLHSLCSLVVCTGDINMKGLQ